jgi:glycosyltransferase involved in cell wall biosynthesis
MAGGPIKSISNIVDGLSSNYNFFIFTRAKDLGSNQNYQQVKLNKWNHFKNSKVFYSNSLIIRLYWMARLIYNKDVEFIYLNSLYSFNFSILIVFLSLIFNKKILIAPRGELSPGAQIINQRKKLFFNLFINNSYLYSKCLWHATSEYEMHDILNILKVNANKIFIANNVPSKVYLMKPQFAPNNDSLKLVFYSRISRKKNLDFIIKCLANLKSKIVFDIYGPIEDLKYWNLCKLEINKLPINVSVNYRGILIPDNVGITLINYDLFVFPTLGENFGHVIYESLISGLPVLLSRNTPWSNRDYKILTTLDLKIDFWAKELEIWASFSKEQILLIKHATYNYALDLNLNKTSIDETNQMFDRIINFK